MKKILLLFILLPIISLAQIAPKVEWQSNYWKTRANFVNNFCVIGDGPGQSIPFNRNPFPWRPCENPEYQPGKKTFVGAINAGDATIRLGQQERLVNMRSNNTTT